MRILGLLVFLPLLGGCAADIMAGYIGKPIEAAQIDYGPQSNIIEMQDGRRAYQWNRNSSGIMPITNYNSGTAYGAGGFVNTNGSSTSYVPYERNCLYTLFATKQGSTWIVTGFNEPSLMCN